MERDGIVKALREVQPCRKHTREGAPSALVAAHWCGVCAAELADVVAQMLTEVDAVPDQPTYRVAR